MNLLDKKREEHLCRALQRVGSVLVCISLLLALAFPPQPAKAFAVADDVAIAAIVAAFLASCGMTLHASGMDNAAIAQQVYNMTDEWVKANYGTPEEQQQVYEDLKDVGFKDGLILIGGTAAGALTNLAQWVKDKFSVAEGSEATVFSSSENYFELSNGQKVSFAKFSVSDDPYNPLVLVSSGTDLTMFGEKITLKNGNFIQMYRYVEEQGGYVLYYFYNSNGKRVCDFNFGDGRTPISCFMLGNQMLSMIDGNVGVIEAWTGVQGWYCKYDSNLTYFFADCSFTNQVDLGLVGSDNLSIPTTIPDTQELTISTGAASDLTLDQALEQILAAIAAGELSATKEIAEAGTATGEDVVPVDEAYPDVGELGLPALANTLTTRFPFSIPWDIAKAVKLLAAPAKTPRFEVDFMAPIAYRFGGKLGDTKIVLDFADYEIIGQVSRWTSTIGFCLFLASGTKKLIWTA